MKALLLWAQQKERYDGEYAPDLVAAIDEYGYDYNPKYMEDEIETLKNDGSVAFFKLMEIEIDEKEFDAWFYQKAQVFHAKIVGGEE